MGFDVQVIRVTCPLPMTSRPSSVDERPKPVENLRMTFYAMNMTNRDAVHVEDHGMIQQICLKVNFTLDPSTAKNIEAVSLSLYSANYQYHVAMLCQLFHFSSNLTYCSVLDDLCNYDNKRVFVSDCMCNLLPAGSYRLTVRTHPEDQLTNSPYDTDVSQWFYVPDCSVYPLDHHCPRGLRVWKPRYSMSQQQPDYTSMMTCFTLPPKDAATFDIFLYDVEADYQRVKDKNLTRSSVEKKTEVLEGEIHQLACITFQGLSTNRTYLPALRLNDGGEPLDLQYLRDAKLFLFENPCKSGRCGDPADGVCVSNLSKYECICNEAAIFNGETCRRDVDDPVVTNCPQSFEVPTSAGNCSAYVEWTEVIATDNSGRVNLLHQSHQTNKEFDIGDTVVKYEFEDRAGNRADCMFTVSVIDDTPPVFESCPETIEGRLSEGETHTKVTWNVMATDNCGQVYSDIPLLQSRPFPLGRSKVSVNTRDSAGNNSTCSITVMIHAAPFNFLRWLIVCGVILLLVVAIISILWRYRGKLKTFKAFLKSHQPYSLSVEGSLPGPLATTACRTPPNGEIVVNWLTQDVTSIPETLSQEDVVSSHLRFEPVALISGERAPMMMKADTSGSSSPEDESKDDSIESDCLVGSVDFSRSDSEVGSTFL